jgi:hypothetical protein
MSIFNNNILAGAAAQSTTTPVHTIDQSIRFNDDDSPSLDKTYSGAGSRTTFTFSCWFKIGNTGVTFPFFNGGTGASDTGWTGVSYSSSKIYVQGFNTNWKITSRVLRDPSAWYHLVFVWDTTNTIASERIRIYINGQRETDFSTSNNPSASANAGIGQAQKHSIGYQSRAVGSGYADAYMAELVYIDGTALDPSSFGEYNSSNIWIPKDVSGLTFGTNGFHIDGRDSADLGDDESGNGNDFTTSGLAAHDQVADSPTNNFCVMNPLNTNSSMTLSNGNLQSTASAHTGSGGTILLPSTGKWYCEFRYNSGLNNEYPVVGVYNTIKNLTTTAVNPGKVSGDLDVGFGIDGRRNEDDTNTSSWGNSVTNGKIGALAIDTENKKIWFGHNNSGSFVWQVSGDPSAGTNEANTKDFADDLIFGNSHYIGSNLTWNFGQDGTFGGTETAQGNTDANGVGNFYFTVPTGYQALCTKNIGA